MLVLGTILASLVVANLADEETLNGADSNTITVLDPRKLTRSSSNINAAAINSLTGSGTVPSADGKSNETTLIFATHVTEPAPQLETHSELNNQLGQTVYLQAQPQPQHNHHDHQQSPHHGGQFLYPQPAPIQSGNLGSHGSTLNAPGGILLHFNDNMVGYILTSLHSSIASIFAAPRIWSAICSIRATTSCYAQLSTPTVGLWTTTSCAVLQLAPVSSSTTPPSPSVPLPPSWNSPERSIHSASSTGPPYHSLCEPLQHPPSFLSATEPS